MQHARSIDNKKADTCSKLLASTLVHKEEDSETHLIESRVSSCINEVTKHWEWTTPQSYYHFISICIGDAS